MNPFRYIDNHILLDRGFERFSHWSQKTIGLDCLWWMKHTFIVGFFSFVANGIIHRDYIWTTITVIIYVLVIAVLIPFHRMVVEQQAAKGLRNRAYANPLDVFNRWVIMFSTVFGPLGVCVDEPTAWHVTYCVMQFFLFCYFYFSACTPLPPCTSKLVSRLSKSLSSWTILSPVAG
jgi:hypothetical protein